jgi:hypothetical protein
MRLSRCSDSACLVANGTAHRRRVWRPDGFLYAIARTKPTVSLAGSLVSIGRGVAGQQGSKMTCFNWGQRGLHVWP